MIELSYSLASPVSSVLSTLDWDAPWRAGVDDEFDRFVQRYRMAFGPDVEVTASRALSYFGTVTEPRLRKAREELSEDTIEARKTIRELSDMMLHLLDGVPDGSEERENLLYAIGRHFVEELEDAGLLSGATPFHAEQPLPVFYQQYALVA